MIGSGFLKLISLLDCSEDALWHELQENSGFRGSGFAAIAAVLKVTTNQG